ncbi:MAG TPA: TonB-dependent receptor [Acidobacteriaceae bacterium]|nr:TonB-dependent receptor [Acidobacteriaceae bacterium]
MHTSRGRIVFAALALLAIAAPASLFAQTAGGSGTLHGSVTDPTGAIVSDATITVENPVSGYSRQTKTDNAGQYQFTNLPLNPYHLTISAPGFNTAVQDVSINSPVPMALTTKLQVGAASTSVTVTATDLIESDPTFHTDVDRKLFDKLPLESQSSSLSSLVTLASPGIAADSNGLFHGLGDHASNSFSIDGQPITDQQSKVFSNQLPSNSVQSLEVIDGAPPAEYGGKTSVVIQVTTRSGEGVTKPTGSISTSYGSFGSATASADLSYGGKNWGNFIEVDGLNTGRFLDPPEFRVFHDKGNEFNAFDRIDRQLSVNDSMHLNLEVSRSWFQTPNAYDNLGIQNVVSGGTTANPVFGNVGNTDQRSKIVTFNIAPSYTRTLSPNAVLNFDTYVRRDGYNYYPSNNPLADQGPPDLQNETIGQQRSLLNAGLHASVSYVKGANNIKAGVQYSQTFLDENDRLAIVAPTYNSPCVDGDGNAVPGFTSPVQCAGAGYVSNDASLGGSYDPNLLPYDLTRGGGYYTFLGHTDVKELGLYAEDSIKTGNWLFNLGIRGDLYNGLAVARQAEPRLGASYTIRQTGTVLRLSYARTLESPFNENLVLSSIGCGSDVLSPLLACSPGVSTTLEPGYRNEFHAGLQQAFGRNLVFSGEYIWKYTHNAFDFSVLGNTPITFPIDWHNSKIPGFALRTSVPNFHHLSAFVVMSSVSARFFPPQSAGAGATVGQSGYPFRIDHDERFNQTAHMQYQLPGRLSPWIGFNWRFDSGLVAGSAPCYNVTGANTGCGGILIGGQPGIDLTGLTADQQYEAGLACDGVKATPGAGFNQCLASQLTSSLLTIPAPNTEDDDKNPPRIAQRNLFDLVMGTDNLLGKKNTEKNTLSASVTVVNLTNKVALYNFLSTFSGTHYVSPRTVTGQVTYHF